MTRNPPCTVFFLSDFGTEDEFAGVVHAVIAARAPGTTVIDLTHHVPPFDVRAGSHTLVRAVPHLGPGVVLAVVDPGVGTLARPWRSSGPTTGCSSPPPKRRPRHRSPASWS
jgi:S-adenosylmethionine hydrolase